MEERVLRIRAVVANRRNNRKTLAPPNAWKRRRAPTLTRLLAFSPAREVRFASRGQKNKRDICGRRLQGEITGICGLPSVQSRYSSHSKRCHETELLSFEKYG